MSKKQKTLEDSDTNLAYNTFEEFLKEREIIRRQKDQDEIDVIKGEIKARKTGNYKLLNYAKRNYSQLLVDEGHHSFMKDHEDASTMHNTTRHGAPSLQLPPMN